MIEVILVVAIIAVVVTGATFGLGAITRTRLRSASFKVMSAARYAYNRAITQGTTTRLHFDFERNTMAVEEATAVMVQMAAMVVGGICPFLNAIVAWEMAAMAVMAETAAMAETAVMEVTDQP